MHHAATHRNLQHVGAVCYNFDAMAKYTMYSWADGRLKPYQVERIIGQMERSAKVMLDGTVVSAYAEKQLENITRLVIHYAIEAIIAHHPGDLAAAKEIGCSPTLVEKRTLEFFGEHLGGSWVALLTLLFKKTSVALDGLCDAMHRGGIERAEIYKRLYNEAASIKDVSLDPLADSDRPDDYSGESTSEDNVTVPSDSEPQTSEIASESDSSTAAVSVSSSSEKSLK